MTANDGHVIGSGVDLLDERLHVGSETACQPIQSLSKVDAQGKLTIATTM